MSWALKSDSDSVRMRAHGQGSHHEGIEGVRDALPRPGTRDVDLAVSAHARHGVAGLRPVPVPGQRLVPEFHDGLDDGVRRALTQRRAEDVAAQPLDVRRVLGAGGLDDGDEDVDLPRGLADQHVVVVLGEGVVVDGDDEARPAQVPAVLVGAVFQGGIVGGVVDVKEVLAGSLVSREVRQSPREIMQLYLRWKVF